MTTITKSAARPCEPSLETGTSPPSVRPVKIGLIGLGRIGRAFRDLVLERAAAPRAARLSLERVLVRDPARDRAEAAAITTADPSSFLASDYDVVVDASDAVAGIEPVLAAFLERGTAVITANKALVAERGTALSRVAAVAGTTFRFDASVAPGIPIFSLFEHSLRTTRIVRIEAVLNGTTNFVLSRLAAGAASLSDALTEARLLGYAEPDPDADVSGLDSARKLSILGTVLGREPLPLHAIRTRGIAGVRPADCDRAAASGCRLKLVARADLDSARPRAQVAPEPIPDRHPLASVELEKNGILLTADDGSELFFSGAGAGPRPTAAALLDDVLCAVESQAFTRIAG